MGGYGSGRPREKPALDGLRRLKASDLASWFERPAAVEFRWPNDRRAVVRPAPGGLVLDGQLVGVVTTRPQFGGARRFFVCPHCGRRCLILLTNDRTWACRRCWRANYQSQKEDRFERLIRRARKLRARLGETEPTAPIDHVWGAGYPPDRPKRMRRKTYAELAAELETVERAAAEIHDAIEARLIAAARKIGIEP